MAPRSTGSSRSTSCRTCGRNFGFLGNVTFVQARQTYLNPPMGRCQAIADLHQPVAHQLQCHAVLRRQRLPGARLGGVPQPVPAQSAAVNPGGINDVIIQKASLNVDVSSSYKIDENFTVTLEGINLTNQHSTQYVDSIGQRDYYNHQTGRQFNVGLRYNY